MYNIDFDITALFFFGAMLFVFYYKKCVPSLQNKVFALLLWVSFLATACDIIDWVITANSMYFPVWVQMAVLYLYFIFINLLPALYAFYILSITGVQGKVLTGARRILFFTPLAVSAAVIMANPFTNWLFYLDEARMYARGPAVYILNVTALYFLVYGVVEVMLYRRAMRRGKSIALYLFSLLAAVPMLIQLFIPNVFITMFGVAVCMFLIFMTLQSPEEVMSSTGLLNRSALISTAGIYYYKKEHFTAFALHMGDYSYYRRVFGSAAMLDFLNEAAQRLDRFLLPGKQTYYVDEGRFVLLCPARETHAQLPQQLAALMDAPVRVNGVEIGFSSRICVIDCPGDAADLDTLMGYVEDFQKHCEERAPVCYAREFALSGATRAKDVERALERALANGGFAVHYQPIYSTGQNAVHSAEAVVRLHDDVLGDVAPSEFIPIAERNGTILRIGKEVLRSVCAFYAANGLKEIGIDYVEVNLSVAQCMQKDLAEQILALLEEYGLSTGSINLEITETVAAGSPETLHRNMKVLSRAGVAFSLDDYGTGYSSMVSVVELPFTLVKIDQGMIERLADERTQVAVRNTVTMLKQLGLGIVAEGVENETQARVLTEMGCDLLQGYYYAKPLPGQEFLGWLREASQDKTAAFLH